MMAKYDQVMCQQEGKCLCSNDHILMTLAHPGRFYKILCAHVCTCICSAYGLKVESEQ